MSTRRPRIKALANLGSKRKVPAAKIETREFQENTKDTIKKSLFSEEIQYIGSNDTNIGTNALHNFEDVIIDQKSFETSTSLNQSNESIQNNTSGSRTTYLSQIEIVPEVNSDTFKCPKSFEFKRTNELEECARLSSIEDNVIQLDLLKSNQMYSASPSKSRQRIKATPIFGHRRNSLIGSSPNPFIEDDQKRGDIKNICSPNAYIYGPKWSPAGTGRTRTESGCSTFSDSWSRDLTGKQRKSAYEDHPRLPLSRREFQNKYNGKVPEKSTLKMFDLIYYNPTTNPMESSPQKFVTTEKIEKEEIIDSLNSQDDLHNNKEEVIPVPQLKLGVNGEVMLDEKSLEIETTANKEARKVLSNTSLMYLDENSGHNGFYKRKKRTKDWPPEETIKFYKCLHTIGTDFSLMLSLFPNRSRRDLKLKFKKEERSNLGLVNKALMYPKVFDIEELQKQLETEDREYEFQKSLKKNKSNDVVLKHKRNFCSSSILSKSSRTLNDDNLLYFVDEKELKRTKIIPKCKVTPKCDINELSNQDAMSENLLSQIITDEAYEQKTFDMVLNLDNIKSDIATNSTSQKFSIITPIIADNEQKEKMFSKNSEAVNVEHLMTELNNGLLAIVASEDPTGTIVEEIYSIDQNTNQLSNKPIDVPSNIVSVIVKAMSR